MIRPRIFISHSAKEDYANEFLEMLSSKLREENFDVLVDKERLKPGANWRNEIYTWMGLCHGSIILLSESACRKSIWVPRETSILLWRRTLQPTFRVIPVCLGPVTEKELKNADFADLNFSDIHAISPGPIYTNTINSILDELKYVRSDDAITPLERLAELICHLLASAPDTRLSAATESLGIDLGPWHPTNNPRKALALKLLQANLKDSTKALESLIGYIDAANADQILDLIAPSWVDLCAARKIPECTARLKPKPIFVLNAHSFFSAKMYVRRASCLPVKTSWRVFPYSGIHGENTLPEIIAEIEACLLTAFGIETDPFDQRSGKEQLDAILAIRHDKGIPVFFVMPHVPAISELLPDLQQALPLITFFLLSGDDLPSAGFFNEDFVRFLEPKLRPDAEKLAQDDYAYARSVLCSRGSY